MVGNIHGVNTVFYRKKNCIWSRILLIAVLDLKWLTLYQSSLLFSFLRGMKGSITLKGRPSVLFIIANNSSPIAEGESAATLGSFRLP